MTRHLARLIWNRKRHNFLLAVEIFFSFLVLFGVVLLAVAYADNWRRPLGYRIDRVWIVEVDRKQVRPDPAATARDRETFRQLFAVMADLRDIEVAAASFTAPYNSSQWGDAYRLQDGRRVEFGVNSVTDTFAALLGLRVLSGRWFSREDAGAPWVPIVVNARMAREIFGDTNVVGRAIPIRPDANRGSTTPMRERRIVGVVDEFRKDGEYSTPGNFAFTRADLDNETPGQELPSLLLVRVAPGTRAEFEETLVKRLQDVARTWSFEVATLDARREDTLRRYTTPLIAVGTVAGFLLLMAALGLTGVVWQSVTQRTREFGLRRAKGATIPNVRRQVLAELLIMTSIALLAGVALVVQIPLVVNDPDLAVAPEVFATSVALSVVTIYLLTLACGWYPSRLATKIQPAEALHYE